MSIINRETDYAIRIIRALPSKGERSVSKICEEQHIKKPFAYKIAKKLQKAGFIGIERGNRGGIYLNCDLSKVSLFDLFNALDNRQLVNDCFKEGFACEYCNDRICHTHENLSKLQNSVNMLLKSTSLEELL